MPWRVHFSDKRLLGLGFFGVCYLNKAIPVDEIAQALGDFAGKIHFVQVLTRPALAAFACRSGLFAFPGAVACLVGGDLALVMAA